MRASFRYSPILWLLIGLQACVLAPKATYDQDTERDISHYKNIFLAPFEEETRVDRAKGLNSELQRLARHYLREKGYTIKRSLDSSVFIEMKGNVRSILRSVGITPECIMRIEIVARDIRDNRVIWSTVVRDMDDSYWSDFSEMITPLAKLAFKHFPERNPEKTPPVVAYIRSKQDNTDRTVKDSEKPSAAITTVDHWAVIIGISKYQYSGPHGLTNLIFADDDARAFARTLIDLGWSESHIKLFVNGEATKRNIEIALESWLTKVSSRGQVVLFWAGHGYPDPENPEKVYLATYDTDISIPATGYRMDRVRAALEEIKSKNVILLADTCHAGKLITRGERGISILPQIDKMQREQRVPKGWIFMVGADTDRQAIEHTSWTNGAFTHSLIKGLSGEADGFLSMGPKDNIVTMGELRAYMNTAMPDETQKVLGVAKRPVITTSTGDPDIWNLTLQMK